MGAPPPTSLGVVSWGGEKLANWEAKRGSGSKEVKLRIMGWLGGRIWSKSVEYSPNMVEFGPNLAERGCLSPSVRRRWPYVDRTLPASAPCRPESTRVLPNLGVVDSTWPGFGKTRPALREF